MIGVTVSLDSFDVATHTPPAYLFSFAKYVCPGKLIDQKNMSVGSAGAPVKKNTWWCQSTTEKKQKLQDEHFRQHVKVVCE